MSKKRALVMVAGLMALFGTVNTASAQYYHHHHHHHCFYRHHHRFCR